MLFTIDPKLVPFIDTNAEGQGVATIMTADAKSVTLGLGQNVIAKIDLADALEKKTITKGNLRDFVRGGKVFFNGAEAVRFETTPAKVAPSTATKSGSARMIGND